VEPSAPVTISNINKIHGAIVLAAPICIFDMPHRSINKHQASGAQ